MFYICHVQPQEDWAAVVAHKTGVALFIVMKISSWNNSDKTWYFSVYAVLDGDTFSLVGGSQYFGGTCCFHLQSQRPQSEQLLLWKLRDLYVMGTISMAFKNVLTFIPSGCSFWRGSKLVSAVTSSSDCSLQFIACSLEWCCSLLHDAVVCCPLKPFFRDTLPAPLTGGLAGDVGSSVWHKWMQ